MHSGAVLRHGVCTEATSGGTWVVLGVRCFGGTNGLLGSSISLPQKWAGNVYFLSSASLQTVACKCIMWEVYLCCSRRACIVHIKDVDVKI